MEEKKNALVLALKNSGEANKSAILLTDDEGIVYATLFGGAKSKLRSLVSPMNTGRIWIQRNLVKKTARIQDFKVEKCRLSFRENFEKSILSNVMAEILIKTHAAANAQESFVLANAFLDGMEFFDEAETERGFVRFLWRYLSVLGEQPDSATCVHCGATIFKNVVAKIAFDTTERGFVCADCFDEKNTNLILLSKEGVQYLNAISTLSPKKVREIHISNEVLQELKNFCTYLVEEICDFKLKSISSFFRN